MREFQVLEQRAIALATVLLTRHVDIRIHDSRTKTYDLDVEISHGKRSTGRFFAVELKAALTTPRLGRLIDQSKLKLAMNYRRGLEQLQSKSRDLPVPLLFLAFAMDSDNGYWGWLREPASSGALRSCEVSFAQLWGSTTHRDVVAQVDAWYKARADAM